MSIVSLFKQLWEFMRVRKKFWLLPIIMVDLAVPSCGRAAAIRILKTQERTREYRP